MGSGDGQLPAAPRVTPFHRIRSPIAVPIVKDRLRPIRRLALCLGILLGAAPLAAQPDLRLEMDVAGEGERYLRLLQVAGEAPLYPWSIRGLSPAEVDRLVPDSAGHPWAARLAPRADSAHVPALRLVRPGMRLVFNSAFPEGANDGPVWAARGLTVSGSAGAQLRAGPLTIRLEPMAFWTENRAFDLMPNGRPDSLRFRSGHSPSNIDLPQRHGEGAYARIDPGNSTVRLDGRGFALGASTATQQWGPAIDQPLVLGANGPGFPHVFAGTSNPWNVGIGRVHGRLVYGSLAESEQSPMRGEGTRRYMSGLVGVFMPRGLDGLELGVLRFFHDPWPTGGLTARNLARPLEGFFKIGLDRDTPEGEVGVENQLASAFVRWVLPRSGVEVYGEYTREDYSWDLMDGLLEPDRASGYMVGGRKAWQREDRLYSLRAEWVDTQRGHLNQSRSTGVFYRHGILVQGHTVRGQLLGSPAGYGGGGSVVAFDAYTPRGRWSADWTRTRVASPTLIVAPGVPDPEGVDVVHSLGGEVLWLRGGVDLLARVRGSWELNRHFADDAFNLNAALGVRLGF